MFREPGVACVTYHLNPPTSSSSHKPLSAMPNLRLSGLWAQIPWRRRKEEPDESVAAKRRSNTTWRDKRPLSRAGPQSVPDVTQEQASDPNTRISRIWKSEDISEGSSTRALSASYRRFSRSFEPPSQQAFPVIIEEEGTASTDALPTEETLLKRLKRKSQTFTQQRPRTSSGVSKRRSFWGTTETEPDVPVLPPPSAFEDSTRTRARHVPISIDYLLSPSEADPIANRQSIHDPGPGIAITSNDVQKSSKTTEQSRPKSSAFSDGLSQLRHRTSKRFSSFQRPIPELASVAGDDEHDTITALPSAEIKDLRRTTSNMSHTKRQTSDGPYIPADRQTFQRAQPKVVDILAPRPMSMITASATPNKLGSRPSTANATTAQSDRRRSLMNTSITPITTINDEDGPKGDWTRTRHSWLGMDSASSGGGSEQMEWEKLKQFIEAYSGGGDTGVVSIRQVDNSSSSSGSDLAKPKYSNAQALAALEFGLT